MLGIEKKLFIVAITIASIVGVISGGTLASALIAAPSIIVGIMFLTFAFIAGMLSFLTVLGTASFIVAIYKYLIKDEDFDLECLVDGDILSPALIVSFMVWTAVLCWLIGVVFVSIFA
jgi:hypothetical protein